MEQTEEICPADRKIYALRDVTNTVASNPLICGSIMSKKIAEGIQGLVLDIKVGNGAFMETLEQAKDLGKLLKEVGELYGLKVSTCFTDMNQPLGNTAGLWCEVLESIECLKGNGPDDLMAVVYHLGESALTLVEVDNPMKKLEFAISDGSALEKFRQMVETQGGFSKSLENPDTHAPLFREKILAKMNGYITTMNTLELGNTLIQLGTGRKNKNDHLDYTAGIYFYKKTGDIVNKSEAWAEIFCSNSDKLEAGSAIVKNTIQIETEKPAELKLIY